MDREDRASRRKFLRSATGATAVVLAGCSGGEESNSDQPSQSTNAPDSGQNTTSGSGDRNDEFAGDNTSIDFVTQILNGEDQPLESIGLGPESQTSQAYVVAVNSEQELGDPGNVSVYIADPDSSQTWGSPLPNQLGEDTVTYSNVEEFLSTGDQYNITAEVQFDEQTETATVPLTLLQSIAPEITMEGQPEMAKPLTLNVSSEAENAEYVWTIGGEQMEGSTVEIVPEDVGELDVSLQASKGDRQQTNKNTFDVQLWDNKEMRLKQMRTHPKQSISPYDQYEFRTMDEEAIRHVISDSTLDRRRELFNGLLGVTNILDYENVKSRSRDHRESESYEVYDIQSVLEQAQNHMEEISLPSDLDADARRFRGDLKPSTPLYESTDQFIEHEIYFFHSDNLLLLSQLEAMNDSDVYGNPGDEEQIKLRAKAFNGQINTIEDDIGLYLEDELHDRRGFLDERVGGLSDDPRLNPESGFDKIEQIISLENASEEYYNGFGVGPVLYDAEEDEIYNFLKAPFAPIEYTPRGEDYAEISINRRLPGSEEQLRVPKFL